MDLIGKNYKNSEIYIADIVKYTKTGIERSIEPVLIKSETEYRNLDMEESLIKLDDNFQIVSMTSLNDYLINNGFEVLTDKSFTDKQISSYIRAIEKKKLMPKDKLEKLDNYSELATNYITNKLSVPGDETITLKKIRTLTDLYGHTKEIDHLKNIKTKLLFFKKYLNNLIKINLYNNGFIALGVIEKESDNILRQAASKSGLGIGYFPDHLEYKLDSRNEKIYTRDSYGLAKTFEEESLSKRK